MDLTQIKLPLSTKDYLSLTKSLNTGALKWDELSEEQQKAYQKIYGDRFQERIESQQQALIVDLEPNFPQFKSDISTIKRTLSELINNACKYTPAHETITLSAVSTDLGIKLSVCNTGTEISPEEQQRVFDKFYRIPHHDPWKFGGTGIGLALVKNLIELLGGQVYLHSEAEKTVFIIDLPCETDS